MGRDVMFPVFREKQFQQENEQEKQADPPLDFHVQGLVQKQDIVECIPGNADQQKQRQYQNDDMQEIEDAMLGV
jgi:hypothetical protein